MLLVILLLLLLLLGSIMIAIQFPYVQTKLVNKASTYLSDKIKFPISVEGVDIFWFDQVVLEGVTVYDPWKNKMVYIGEAAVDFEIVSLVKGIVNVEKVTLANGEVKMIRYAPNGDNNLTDFVEALQNLAPPRDKSKKPVPFVIKKVEVVNMIFSFDDKRKPFLTDIFDHNHFFLDSIYADVSNLRVVADTFQIDVHSLTTVDRGIKLKVHNLETLFTLTKHDMTFENLHASIGNSFVQDYLRFNYKEIDDLSDFNDKTDIITHLLKCQIDFNDLEKFAIELKPYKEKVTISGNASGKVTNFTIESLDMEFGSSSHIKGDASFKGLPEFFETFIEFNFKNTKINTKDLFQYIKNKDAINVLKKFGVIYSSGTFTGFPQDFVTNASFSTDLGKLKSDIRLNAKRENAKPEYKGRLITQSFNLGKLIDYPKEVQFIDMDGTIEGAGFQLADAELSLNSTIQRIGILNYNYKNIKTNAKLSQRTFNGFLSIKDTNLVFTANGMLDLTTDKEKFDIAAHLEKANLKQLGFSHVEALVKTDLDLDFSGTEIDEIIGTANFKNTYLLFNNEKEIIIDSLYANSKIENNERTIEVQSDLVSLKAKGDFNITNLFNDVEELYNEYELTIKNNSFLIEKYYASKDQQPTTPYRLDFEINVKNLNSIFEFYLPGLYLSKGLELTGNFHHGNNSMLNFNTHIDTLYYKEIEIFKTDIEISTSKLRENSEILGMFFVNSERQRINELPPTKNMTLEGIWDKNKIDFITKIDQDYSTNKIHLEGSLSLLDENKKMLSINRSELKLLNQDWFISPNNSITFAQKEINFDNLKLFNKDQFFKLDGTISDYNDKEAYLSIGNFKLNTLNSLIPGYSLNGTLNANIVLKDLYKDLDLEGEVDVEKFAIDNFILGNIKGESRWDNQERKLLLDIKLERDEQTSIDLKGYVLPQSATSEEKIDLKATLDNADLKILSPIVKGVLSDLSGKVSGSLNMKGTIKKPEITGEALVQNGKFKIDYLGTTYFFNDTIYMAPNNIGFRQMRIRDEYGNRGTIQGGIAHDGFKNFIVDISGKMNNLNILNTSENDNELFYGNAFATGDFSVLGPFADLTISANATSKKGTHLYIPISSAASTEKQSFISFIDEKTKKNKLEIKDTIDLSGIDLNFNFELTPDATVEIIFDKRTGDIIRGNGSGDIKMTIDTRGDFNMYGNYRLTKGAYNYSLAGLISREFNIEPNSSINWTGDPYGGILDVQAYYERKVSLIPLIDDSLTRVQEAGRTYPTRVLLDLKGELLSPQIALNIDIIPTTGNANLISTEFESTIQRNEQLLNKQVFSLLVLGNFSPENSFTGTGGSASNVSQLLTNQLGNWLSQVDENLVIDIDLNSLDKDALNTFNLRLSYTALDGRLRISRDGSFTNLQNNPNSQQSLSNIAGEWTVEYLLSKEGKFRLKLYNKNNQNQLMNSFTNINNTSAGFSLLHTQSFNSLNELLGTKKKSKDKKEDNLPKIDAVLPKKAEE